MHDKFTLTIFLMVASLVAVSTRGEVDPASCEFSPSAVRDAPAELVHAAAFDDINKDGRSTGRGVIEKLERK